MQPTSVGSDSSGGARFSQLQITPRLLFGGFLLVLGVLFLLNQMGVVGQDFLSYWWPAGMVLLGAVQVAVGENRIAKSIGFCLVLLGATLLVALLSPGLVDTERVGGFVGAAAIVAVGGFLVFTAQGRREKLRDHAGSDLLRVVCVLSGQELHPVTSSFRGGDLTAIMGGIEIDLTDADIADGEEAVLDVLAFMGGGEIVVPDTWDVDCSVLPVMGGASVKTRRPPQDGSPRKRLRIRGLAVMGALEVRNPKRK